MVSGQATLREIVNALQETYCRTIGAEYMHIVDSEQRSWFVQRLESVRGRPEFSPEIRAICSSVLPLPKVWRSTWVPSIRVPSASVWKVASLIPLLDEIIQRSGSYGTKEIVIGMAHRGRLNVLVNTFGKNPRDLFDEFEGKKVEGLSSGDVKVSPGFLFQRDDPGRRDPRPWRSTLRTWRSFLRWSRVPYAPARIVATTRLATRSCRSPSTVTPLSPVRVS